MSKNNIPDVVNNDHLICFIIKALNQLSQILFVEITFPPELMMLIKLIYLSIMIHPNNILYVIEMENKYLMKECICDHVTPCSNKNLRIPKNKPDSVIMTYQILKNTKAYCQMHSKNKMMNILFADKWNALDEPRTYNDDDIFTVWTTRLGKKKKIHMVRDKLVRVCPFLHERFHIDDYSFYYDHPGHSVQCCRCERICCGYCMMDAANGYQPHFIIPITVNKNNRDKFRCRDCFALK
jgi:hypothetical protein